MTAAKKLNFDHLKSQITPAVTTAILAHFELASRFTRDGEDALRGGCPFACEKTDGRSFKITADGRAWFNHNQACKCLPMSESTGQRVRGGNMLDFIRYKQGGTIREAAETLDSILTSLQAGPKPAAPAKATKGKPKAEVPQAAADNTTPLRNLTFAERNYKPLALDPGADCVAELGLEPIVMENIGAGYAANGMMKGRVAFPIKNSEGKLVAYGGFRVSEEAGEEVWKYPTNFRPELEVSGISNFLVSHLPGARPPNVYVAFDLLEAAHVERMIREGDDGVFDNPDIVVTLLAPRLSEQQKQLLANIAHAVPLFEVMTFPSPKSAVTPGLADEVTLFLSRLAPVRFRER